MDINVDNWTDLSNRKVGVVLQTKTTYKLETQTISGTTSYVPIMQVSITPRYANSKILVLVKASLSPSNGTHYTCQLKRGGTLIAAGDSGGSLTQSCMHASYGLSSFNTAGYEPRSNNGHWLDSPNTTNPIIYSYLVGTVHSTGYSVGVNYNIHDDNGSNWNYRTTSTLTVMEIAQ